MEYRDDFSDNDLPDLKTILLPCPTITRTRSIDPQPCLRRSPRKHARRQTAADVAVTENSSAVMASSNQRKQSPAKNSPSKRMANNIKTDRSVTMFNMLDHVPKLPKKTINTPLRTTSGNRQHPATASFSNGLRLTHVDSLLLPLSKLTHSGNNSSESDSQPAFIMGKARPKTRNRSSSGRSVMSLMTEAARNAPLQRQASSPKKQKGRGGQTRSQNAAVTHKFVLGEAACLEDLADSDANDEGEDDDTDLSGFIVDDDAELSYHESMESGNDHDSEHERRSRRRAARKVKEVLKPRRRLQRGRRVVDSENEKDKVEEGDDLADVFNDMKIEDNTDRDNHPADVAAEVIDLTSPEPTHQSKFDTNFQTSLLTTTNLFDKIRALKLSPPRNSSQLNMPPKTEEMMLPDLALRNSTVISVEATRPTPATPPATPPRSPTKLRSPSKLLSPSKRDAGAQRSPHRQSMDAFWDLNAVNSWNDEFSPKKAPIASPRKALKHIDLWSDSEDDSSSGLFEDSSDGLPSPCESPNKTRFKTSPIKSPEKAARLKVQTEKAMKAARKREFDAQKEKMALELFGLLDTYITEGKITKMAASTGGVNIIWSKTLRSTAGRANWKKTRTTVSPTKSSVTGSEVSNSPTIRHFASIELAVKVIDRPERLYNTLAHEFCHLANFMVSGIVDQPHGAQFQRWAAMATEWMRAQSGRPEWSRIEITTKHRYVIEHKYLWICTGRPSTMGGLNLKSRSSQSNEADEIEEGCGAEYGRHSKSIDTNKDRCGVCKGVLVQIRPKPRASPVKKSNALSSPWKKMTKTATDTETKTETKGFEPTVREIEIVELSD